MDDLLLQLSQICSTLYQQTSPFVGSTSGIGIDALDFLLPFPELALDIPSSDYLADTLFDVGVPLPLARELSEIHSRRASELAENYLCSYREACLQVAGDRTDSNDAKCTKAYLLLQRTARQSYKRTLASWEKDLLQTVQNHYRSSSNNINHLDAKRSSFNMNFTPVLEAVFEENPFPSIAVKKALAAKSGMSMNQIKIWFQNHRTRARKNGHHIVKSGPRGKHLQRDKHSEESLKPLSPSSHPLASDKTSSSTRNDYSKQDAGTFRTTRYRSTSEISGGTSKASLMCISSLPQTSESCIRSSIDGGYATMSDEGQNSGLCSPKAISDCDTVIDSGSEHGEDQGSPFSRSSSVTLIDEANESMRYEWLIYASPVPNVNEVLPFRSENADFSFPKPVWTRLSCSKPITNSPPDISALTVAFSNMSLGQPDEATDGRKSSTLSMLRNTTSYPLITPTYSAPLPFLIRYTSSSAMTRSIKLDTRKPPPLTHTPARRSKY
ncbi:hypothetical protein ACEPAI_370 [Sanghuangporus weigelae]